MRFVLPNNNYPPPRIDLNLHGLSGSVNQAGSSRQSLEYDSEPHFAGDFGMDSDKLHDYTQNLNSFGFRGPEFGPTDIVALGCSQTYGVGVCAENVWPEFLSKKLEKPYINLSYVGWSVPRLVREFFIYVNKHGRPRAVALLLPEMSRYMFVTRGTVLNYNNGNRVLDDAIFSDYHLEKTGPTWRTSQLPQVSKRPHLLNDIMPLDHVYFESLNALYSLLTFCQHTEIAVAISSWDWAVVDLLKTLGTIAPEIIGECKYLEGEALCSEDHSELITSLNLEHDEFEWGTDRLAGKDNGHMGVHQHYHYSEVFYEILKKQLTN